MVTVEKQHPFARYLAPTYMILAMLLVPLMDGTAKLMVAEYPLTQVVWGRYIFHLLTLLPLFYLAKERPSLSTGKRKLQITRGLFLLGDTALFFGALSFIPLANGKAVFFAAPLIMTALAPLILKEKVGIHRWGAVLVGFSGTLFILNPNAEGDFIGYILALGSAAFYAIYLLLTRKLSTDAGPLNTLLMTAVIGSVLTSFLLPFGWKAPDLYGLGLMIAMGALGTLSHYFIIKAFEGGDASQLAPLTYSEIVSATIFGMVVFGHFPDLMTWIGISIVIASGLYILHRQRHSL